LFIDSLLFRVQQLNFYSFRKIKYNDSVRIDPKTEEETANYWRFRHENFQRDKAHLLTQVKRTNAKSAAPKTVTTKPLEQANNEKETSNNSEVQALKQKMEQMSKNMKELTAMVQQVSLKQEEDVVGNKRIRWADAEPDVPVSMDLDMMEALPVQETTCMSDDELFDQLFLAFNEEGDDDDDLIETEQDDCSQNNKNRPNAALMSRLGDALALLPTSLQEMIVDRLIAAITLDVDELPSLAALFQYTTDKKHHVAGKKIKSIPVIPVHA
jgi:hypothetical protein